MQMLKKILTCVAIFATLLAVPVDAHAAPKKEFKFAWSIYVGWMPWGWAQTPGLVKKWADKYGIKITVTQFNDYMESVNQYTAGAFDGVTVTNMDALAVPSVGGVDTTAVIIGDYSNGNDAVILKNKPTLAAIKGQKVNLVELSVSHYLLARGLESVKLTEKDITVVNTSDADLAAAYITKDVTAVVTWNPIVQTIMGEKTANNVFDSSKIPGEIMDLAVVNTATLKDNPVLGKALAGIRYDTMKVMSSNTPEGKAAREAMAKASESDLAGFEDQLKTTKMFWTPESALAFAEGDLVTLNDRVRKFLFSHGLMGEGAKSVDVVGIEFPGGKTLGDAANIKFRFTDTYMKMAKEGKL